MERRGFLKGMLAGVSAAAGTALVKLASPSETAALTVGKPTILDQPPDISPEFTPDLRLYMQDAKSGRFAQIGYLAEIHFHGSPIEIDIWDFFGRPRNETLRSLKSFEGRFIGTGNGQPILNAFMASRR